MLFVSCQLGLFAMQRLRKPPPPPLSEQEQPLPKDIPAQTEVVEETS